MKRMGFEWWLASSVVVCWAVPRAVGVLGSAGDYCDQPHKL